MLKHESQIIEKTGKCTGEIKKSGNRLRFPLCYVKESRTEDMNKLRVTGFECFAVFVIRCAMHAPKGAARH